MCERNHTTCTILFKISVLHLLLDSTSFNRVSMLMTAFCWHQPSVIEDIFRVWSRLFVGICHEQWSAFSLRRSCAPFCAHRMQYSAQRQVFYKRFKASRSDRHSEMARFEVWNSTRATLTLFFTVQVVASSSSQSTIRRRQILRVSWGLSESVEVFWNRSASFDRRQATTTYSNIKNVDDCKLSLFTGLRVSTYGLCTHVYPAMGYGYGLCTHKYPCTLLQVPHTKGKTNEHRRESTKHNNRPLKGPSHFRDQVASTNNGACHKAQLLPCLTTMQIPD